MCKHKAWSGIRNSDLLARAEADLDLPVTADQNIVYQQNLTGRSIAILELSINDLRRMRESALIQMATESISPGDFVKLELPAPEE